MARVRVRQHVNPLANKYATPIDPPDWSAIFANLQSPLHLDIGCGWGDFLLRMAASEPGWNFLGLEIRQPLVDTANQHKQLAGLTNLCYLFCNANNSLAPILQSLPGSCLARVSIQFPDPWFKNRHFKRRVVQPEVVELLAQYLQPGGLVFLQSDVEVMEQEMFDRFQAHPAFSYQPPEVIPEIATSNLELNPEVIPEFNLEINLETNLELNPETNLEITPESKLWELWLQTPNPFPVATERETSTLSRGEPIYRAIFKRL